MNFTVYSALEFDVCTAEVFSSFEYSLTVATNLKVADLRTVMIKTRISQDGVIYDPNWKA